MYCSVIAGGGGWLLQVLYCSVMARGRLQAFVLQCDLDGDEYLFSGMMGTGGACVG